jgi:4-amino-4-deoxy-L-arabinose transferase-like glycosyltransferase
MLALFPWEKWLPPYVFGPLMCVGCLCVLVFARDLSWWELLSCGFGVISGALGTCVWFATGRNIFWHSGPKTNEERETRTK